MTPGATTWKPPFRRVLVANRGEIAIRVFRTLRDLGIEAIAIYSDADRDALHVRLADDAYRVGPASPAESYLDIDSVIAAATKAGADAVHPGYGFLAENAEFARRCAAAGIVFVGPPPDAIASMGSKTASRALMRDAGVPIIPGTTEPIVDIDDARATAAEVGFPVAFKARSGGGGRGFRVALSDNDVEAAFAGASGEGERYFADPAVYVERYLERPRHIEMQVLADSHGNVVHLGERDCTIQRRHQKLVEESPSPAVDQALRERLGGMAIAAARAVGYTSAGTVECLLDQHGNAYFLEMNTRVQVEHTVTEEVTGLDIIAEQLFIAAGAPLSIEQHELELRGHAIECRINAEDACDDFRPSSGTIVAYHEPSGPGVRIDSGVTAGSELSPHYDNLVAKLIAVGRDREHARRRMLRALGELRVDGIHTLIPFHRALMAHDAFIEATDARELVADPGQYIPVPDRHGEPAAAPTAALAGPARHVLEVDGRRFEVDVFVPAPQLSDSTRAGLARGGHRGSTAASGGDVQAPIPGTLLSVTVGEGDAVAAGQLLCVIEAMKMENEIVAPHDGVVESVSASAGDAVAGGQVLMHVRTASPQPAG